jgi:hypothetical protein
MGRSSATLGEHHDRHWDYHGIGRRPGHRRARPADPARQAEHSDLAHDPCRPRGALLGTLLAQYIGVAVTAGVDWIEIVLQVAIAAVGVAIVSGLYNARRVKRKL